MIRVGDYGRVDGGLWPGQYNKIRSVPTNSKAAGNEQADSSVEMAAKCYQFHPGHESFGSYRRSLNRFDSYRC